MKNITLFTAPWCGECLSIKSYMEASETTGIEVINVDLEPRKAQEAGIRNLPVLIVEGVKVIGASKIIDVLKTL